MAKYLFTWNLIFFRFVMKKIYGPIKKKKKIKTNVEILKLFKTRHILSPLKLYNFYVKQYALAILGKKIARMMQMA